MLVLALGVAVGVMQLNTPSPIGADAPVDQFSAGRAMNSVDAIAGNGIPHPVGSADLARVRAYLVKQISDMGYKPELESGNQTEQWFSEGKAPPINAPQISSPLSTTAVTNIIVRVPGTDRSSSDAVIVSGHYDSVQPGPGASDDGGAMAAFLEVMRAMKASPPLKHDVIFLFTDAEEPTLGGSTLFVQESPAAKDVKFILNFEYRGTTGKSLFFEGASVDQDLIDTYRQVQPNPLSSSMFFFVYQQLENSTDFAVLNTLGAPGLAFASIGNNVRYHTPTDNLTNFSPGALQYTGDMMLGLVKNLANQDSLASKSGEELVWYNIGPILLSYPTLVAYVLLGMALTMLVIALVFGLRSKVATGRGIARGVGTTLLSGVLAVVVTQLLLAFVYLVRWDTRDFISLTGMFDTDPYRGQLYMVTFVVAVSAITVAMLIRARRFQSIESLQLGALIVFAVVATAATLAAPPAAYVIAIPLLLMSTSALVRVLVKRHEVVTTIELVLAFILVVFTFPLCALIYQGLNLSTGALASLIVALTLCLLVPVIDLIAQAIGQLLSLGLALGAAVMLAIGCATPLVGPNYQQPDSLVYAVDANTGKSLWLSSDKQPDSWTQNVLGTDPTRVPAPEVIFPYYPVKAKSYETQTVLSAPAKVTVPLSAPVLTVQSDQTVGGLRKVKFNTASTRDALNLWYTMSSNTELKTLKVDDQVVRVKPSKTWSILGQGLPKSGYTVEVTLPAGSNLNVVVTDQKHGFPDDPALGLPPRPDTTFSWWPRGKQADATIVTKSYDLK